MHDNLVKIVNIATNISNEKLATLFGLRLIGLKEF